MNKSSFNLGVLDLDLALLNDRHAAIMDSNSIEQKAFYKAWERSNRLSLMFMRIPIVSNIKATIPCTKSAEEYMKLVKERSQFESVNKSSPETLMGTLITMKFDGSCTMHEHVTETIKIETKLKSMGMEVNENFIV